MAKKIILAIVILLVSIICIFGLYYMFNGGISSFIDTTNEISFWQAIKDLFVGIFNGIKRGF